MPKSKQLKKEEEELSGSDATSEELSTTSKKRQLDRSDEKITKRVKTEEVACGSDATRVTKERQGKTLLTTSEGEKYIDLGKKKRAIVRSFKGISLLDIREFYGADGQEKPGKKGISLTLDQWEALRDSASTIDQLFSTQKK